MSAVAAEVLATGDADRVVVAQDARMNEVYTARFVIDESGVARADGAEQVAAPADLPLPDGDDWLAAGTGWAAYAEVLEPRTASVITGRYQELPRASDALALARAALASGAAVDAGDAVPVYVRDRVAALPSR